MNATQLGILINSALYLAGCFVAGLLTGNGIAWRLALVAVGLTYACYVAQEMISGGWRLTIAVSLLIGSILFGVCAGLVLL